MKLINKLMAIAIALLAMVAISACSYEDPDIAFKGNIDANFLNSLARGETSITLSKTDCKEYEMDYQKYLNGSGKWDKAEDGRLGGSDLGVDKLIIINSRTWNPILLFNKSTLAPSLIYEPWEIYCKETGFDKEIYIACPIEYDADSKTLKIENITFSIEKAENDKLILSTVGEIYQYTQPDKFEPTKASKTILFYKKSAMEPPDMDNILYFDTEKEAKLAMVRILRGHFGDYIDRNHYGHAYTYSIINLAQLEDNILNDREESANGVAIHDPKSPY